MINVAAAICKKEIKIRFGSKRVFLPMIFSVGVPMLVFIPNLIEAFSQTEHESEYLRFLLFLILPVMITTLIGINTFINEIRWKTIKSLLVAPVTEGEIFLGKSMACIVTGLVTEVFLSGLILFSLNSIEIPVILLLIVIGPLSVIFTTFIFIIGTSRFPSIAEGGGAILMPISGLLIIFTTFFLLNGFLELNTTFVYVILTLFLTFLVFVTYFFAKRWFNKEKLILCS
jgi:ABC-type transport system involved in multi-copper enzyme maturation permease subunit